MCDVCISDLVVGAANKTNFPPCRWETCMYLQPRVVLEGTFKDRSRISVGVGGRPCGGCACLVLVVCRSSLPSIDVGVREQGEKTVGE